MNIDVVYNCTIIPAVKGNIDNIKKWLLSDPGAYLILKDSYNPDTFRYASCVNAFNFANIKFGVGDGDIVFNCKPFRYLLSGNTPITLNTAGNVSNPTLYASQPRIKVVGSGNISLSINNALYAFTGVSGHIEIDSELESVYKDAELQNNKMTGYPFPTLKSGNNSVSWTGSVSSVVITPRWVTL